jgi:hypothetical protein
MVLPAEPVGLYVSIHSFMTTGLGDIRVDHNKCDRNSILHEQVHYRVRKYLLVDVLDGAADLDEPGPDGVLGEVSLEGLRLLDPRCKVTLVRVLGHNASDHHTKDDELGLRLVASKFLRMFCA